MAKTYAKLVTAHGEYEMSHRELDQLSMLLRLRKELGVTPTADPPILEQDYDDLAEWIEQDMRKNWDGDTEYLD